MPAPIEFERKFLIKPEALEGLLKLAHFDEEIRQGYFLEDAERCVRIRNTGRHYFLTFKVKTEEVGKAIEIETELGAKDALTLLSLSKSSVHKRRHLVDTGEFLWEIDVFLDHNKGLVLAEVELPSDAASEKLSQSLPSWVAAEVTGQPEYFNTWLARNTSVHALPA